MRSCAVLPKVEAAAIMGLFWGCEVDAEEAGALFGVEGFVSRDIGVYGTRPSRMLVIVWSTFLVFTKMKSR